MLDAVLMADRIERMSVVALCTDPPGKPDGSLSQYRM